MAHGRGKKCLIAAAALASAIATAALGAPPPAQPVREPVAIGSLKDWLAAGDYSAEAPAGVVARALDFALTVSARGMVVRCAVEHPSDSVALGDMVCHVLEQKGRFRPALDGSGRPVMGVYRGRVIWAQAGGESLLVPLVEMAVGLQAVPQGLPDP